MQYEHYVKEDIERSPFNELVKRHYIKKNDEEIEILRYRNKLSPAEFIIEYVDEDFWKHLTVNGKDVDVDNFKNSANNVKQFYTIPHHNTIILNTHD